MTAYVAQSLQVKNEKIWNLRNLADPSCDMLRGCTVFHALRFLQMNHLLSLLLFLLVLSVLIRFAPMEHPKLEKIDFGTTIHASFTEVSPFRSIVLDERSSDGPSAHLLWTDVVASG